MQPASQNRPTSQRGKCNPKKHQNCCTKLGPTKIAKRNSLCPEPKPDCGQVVQQRRCQWQCVWPRFESYSARGCVLRFLAASMPRRRGDGGQLVLPVWSTCSGLSGYLQYVSLVSNFLVFWPNFVQNLVEKYRDSGAENCRFWVPVLGTRSGAKIGPQIQDSLIILVSGGNLVPKTGTKNGAENWDQKW